LLNPGYARLNLRLLTTTGNDPRRRHRILEAAKPTRISAASPVWASQKKVAFTGSDAGGESVMIKRVMCAAIALCVASSANAATLRFKNYTTPEDEKQRILNAVYLDGLKEGLITFNVALAHSGAAPLFCLPPKMVLTGDQVDDILMREAKSVPTPDDMPIGIPLLAGLRKTFPCGGQSKRSPD
jgi:hypothetical protein